MPRFREILCYLVIFAITGYILLRPLFGQPRSTFLTPATQSADIAPINPMLIIQGRQVVGMSSLLRMAGAPARKDLADSLKTFAETAVDKFCVLLVRREVDDRTKADADLATLAGQSPILRPDIDTVLHPQTASADTRAALIRRFGWFGELGLSRDLPDTDPLRRHVLAAATHTSLTFAMALFLAFAGAVAGLVLMIIFFVFVAQGKVRPRLPLRAPLPQDPLPYLEGFTLYMVIYFVAPSLLRLLTTNGWAFVPIYLLAPGAAFLWARLRGQSWQTIANVTGLHRGQGRTFFREIFAGIVGYIMGLPALILAYVITLLLISASHANPSHPINNEISTDPHTLLKLFLLASVYAPLVEETLFRGFFYIHMRQRLRPIAGAVLVSLIFAAMHPQGWTLIPVLATIGFVLAMIREYRGSAIANMTAHSLQNTFTLLLMAVALS